MPELDPDRYRVDLRCPGDVLDAVNGAGLALLDGITDRHELTRAASNFMRPRTHRDAEPDRVTDIRPDRERMQRSAGNGFSTHAVAPHTEGTSLPDPPRLLLLACAQPAARGGETILVDGAAVYRDLSATAPDALAALCRPGVTAFGANQYCAPVFELHRSGRVAIRYRDDELLSITESDRHHWDLLRAAVSQHQVNYLLQRGEGILLDNSRWLHGRTEIIGDRHMYRLIGDRCHEIGASPSAHPASSSARKAQQ